jgi:hypothetical protein
MSEEPQPKKAPWHAFWTFNLGHMLIIAGMIGSAWVVVNNVEITLADHTARINKLESDLKENRLETSAQYQRISEQLTDLAREISLLNGQMMLLIPPERRGEIRRPGDGKQGGG